MMNKINFRDLPKEAIQTAVNLAMQYHDGQTRKDGITPFIVHPIEVMKKLINWGVKDTELLVTSVLHDTWEDAPEHLRERLEKDIKNQFDEKIFNNILMLSCMDSKKKQEYLESFAEKPVGILVIKIADRICNVQDYLISNPKYAKKYLDKASTLKKTLYAKSKEIGDTIGGKATAAIIIDINATEGYANRICEIS